jgi:beta-lactamase superfamily II metal-dependent hydrolase
MVSKRREHLCPRTVWHRLANRATLDFFLIESRNDPDRECVCRRVQAGLPILGTLRSDAGVTDRHAPAHGRGFSSHHLDRPLVNLVAVPLIGLIVPLGFVATTSALLAPAVGKISSVSLQWLTVFLLRSIASFAHFPNASYRIPSPRPWLTLTFFLVAIVLAVALRLTASWQHRRPELCRRRDLLCMPGCAVPILTAMVAGKTRRHDCRCGSGRRHLRRIASRTNSADRRRRAPFADVPGHPGEEALSAYLWSRGFRQIDVVALTHAHQDHLGGLRAIPENFRVGHLWIGREAASPAQARLEEWARARHIPIAHQGRGQTFGWSGTAATFFWPESSPDAITSAARNNDSLVFRLSYGSRTILLPGDAEKDAERTMLAENPETVLRADVLKVGHRGSKNSTMPEFLVAVSPRMAIISCGRRKPLWSSKSCVAGAAAVCRSFRLPHRSGWRCTHGNRRRRSSRGRVLWPAPGHAKRYGKRNRQMMNSTANSSKNPTMARYS